MHKTAPVLVDNFIRAMKSQQKLIGEQTSEAVALQVESNRKKLQSIVKTILFVGGKYILMRTQSYSIHKIQAILELTVVMTCGIC